MKILIVEDARIMAFALKRQLSLVGCDDVVLTESAEDALLALQQNPFDAVFLDWRLPGMDGIDLLKMIRRSRRLATTAVVMSTAKDDPNAVIEAFEAGATDYIVKPYDRRVLEEKMTRLAEYCQKQAA